MQEWRRETVEGLVVLDEDAVGVLEAGCQGGAEGVAGGGHGGLFGGAFGLVGVGCGLVELDLIGSGRDVETGGFAQRA